MPRLIAFLLGGLLELAGSLVGRVLLALGLGFVEFQGFDIIKDIVVNNVRSATGAFGGYDVMAAWAGFLQLDVHLGLIISAIGVRMALNAMGGSTIKKLVAK